MLNSSGKKLIPKKSQLKQANQQFSISFFSFEILDCRLYRFFIPKFIEIFSQIHRENANSENIMVIFSKRKKRTWNWTFFLFWRTNRFVFIQKTAFIITFSYGQTWTPRKKEQFGKYRKASMLITPSLTSFFFYFFQAFKCLSNRRFSWPQRTWTLDFQSGEHVFA